jgi:hypothetical protein
MTLDERIDLLSATIDERMAEYRELVAAAKQTLAYVDSLSIGNAATERLRVAVARAEGRLDA